MGWEENELNKLSILYNLKSVFSKYNCKVSELRQFTTSVPWYATIAKETPTLNPLGSPCRNPLRPNESAKYSEIAYIY